MFLLCHPWFTATNLSYTFPILETSATASCGSTGILACNFDNIQPLGNMYAPKTLTAPFSTSTNKNPFIPGWGPLTSSDISRSYSCEPFGLANTIRGAELFIFHHDAELLQPPFFVDPQSGERIISSTFQFMEIYGHFMRIFRRVPYFEKDQIHWRYYLRVRIFRSWYSECSSQNDHFLFWQGSVRIFPIFNDLHHKSYHEVVLNDFSAGNREHTNSRNMYISVQWGLSWMIVYVHHAVHTSMRMWASDISSLGKVLLCHNDIRMWTRAKKACRSRPKASNKPKEHPKDGLGLTSGPKIVSPYRFFETNIVYYTMTKASREVLCFFRGKRWNQGWWLVHSGSARYSLPASRIGASLLDAWLPMPTHRFGLWPLLDCDSVALS